MGFSTSVALLCALLTTVKLSTTARGALAKYSGNETLSVLLLASTDSSYDSSPSTLSEWVNDLFNEVNKDANYQLQLLSFDTQVIMRRHKRLLQLVRINICINSFQISVHMRMSPSNITGYLK